MNLVVRVVLILALLSGIAVYGAKKQEKKLLKAIKAGNTAEVLRLIDKGANPDAKAGGEPYLMCAVQFGHLDMIKAMMEKGAEPGVSNKKGNILHKAVSYGRVNALEVLLDEGADINARGHLNRTPLIQATMKGDNAMVKTLLDHGADPNLQDKHKKQAIHYAVLSGHVQIVEYLLQHQADITTADRLGNNPIQYIRFLQQRSMLDLMIAYGRVEIGGYQPGEATTSLKEDVYLLAGQGKTRQLQSKYAAALDESSETGWTPLMNAVARQRVETVKFLLEAGANPDAMDEEGRTPLGLATQNKDPAIMTLLVAHGAKLLGYRDGRAVVSTENDYDTLRKVFQKNKLIKHIPKRLEVRPYPRPGEKVVDVPIFTQRVPPRYPESAIKARLSGYVILEAVLTKDGRIENVAILRNLDDWGHGFEWEAVNAVKQWKFKPGKVKGEPADVRMTLKIDFVLQGRSVP